MSISAAKLAMKYVRVHQSAMKRNKEFDLSIFYLKNILSQKYCAYSGRKFSKSGENSLSLERIDNRRGYVDGNVIPVCLCLNSLRGSKTTDNIEEDYNSILLNPQELNDVDIALETAKSFMLKDKKHKEKLMPLIQAITDRQDAHKQHLKKFGEPYLTSIFKTRIDTKIKKSVNSIYAYCKIKTPSESITPASELNFRELLAGLKKFENLTRVQKMKISVGLSLDCSLYTLLKSKIFYNMVRGKI